jgi:protein-S-isoprenylcysteine O-methyltransferase Ste14
MKLRQLVGSGEQIALLLLPFVIGGLFLNIASPSLFEVGGPPTWLRVVSILVLIPGVTIWIWSVLLIMTRVPRGELITSGPYALVRHPLYAGVAFLVLPWIGFLLNTWIGVVLGIVLYVGARIFAPEEEAVLSANFGDRWDAYRRSVILPWV